MLERAVRDAIVREGFAAKSISNGGIEDDIKASQAEVAYSQEEPLPDLPGGVDGHTGGDGAVPFGGSFDNWDGDDHPELDGEVDGVDAGRLVSTRILPQYDGVGDG